MDKDRANDPLCINDVIGRVVEPSGGCREGVGELVVGWQPLVTMCFDVFLLRTLAELALAAKPRGCRSRRFVPNFSTFFLHPRTY
jgi:hypothetical protein